MFGRTRNPYRDLEKELGYSFRRREKLTAALTHRSHRFENKGIDYDNQRLEFLGDAVLGLVSAAYLYEKNPTADEGTLTHLRSTIASGKALARVARRMKLGDQLLLGKGEEHCGGRQRESTLADALESVIGAVYLDGGMKAAEKTIRRLIFPELESRHTDAWEENPKGRLQEISQRLWQCSPRYRTAAEGGPSHAKSVVIEVFVNGVPAGRGRGASKREAEAKAAADALEKLAGLTRDHPGRVE